MTREDLQFSFHRFFLSVGPPSPTSKIQHRLKFLAFKTGPNCIGRSWNSSAERPERKLHSRTAKFKAKHFARPCLHETISHLCFEKTSYGSYVTFMPVESTEMSIPCENQNLFFRYMYVSESQYIYASAEGIFEQERKTQYFRTSRQSVVLDDLSREFSQ